MHLFVGNHDRWKTQYNYFKSEFSVIIRMAGKVLNNKVLIFIEKTSKTICLSKENVVILRTV